MEEAPSEQPASPLGEEQQQQQQQQQQEEQTFSLPGLEGEWTLQQLVDMEMQRDPRLGQVRRSALPHEFWDARRRARNHARMQRNYGRRKRRGEALRQGEAELLAGMDEAQQAEYAAAREAEREAAKAAAAEQRERVAAAMDSGLRIVIDCSLSEPVGSSSGGASGGSGSSSRADDGPEGSGRGQGSVQGPAGASDREVRSLCKQLELCAAANKRAARPVSLQFASFVGRVRSFALEGMHADRWPAARGHEAPLEQLFPPDQLVVLSPDATELLGSLEPDKVYVIGGLVDRTVQKGASLKLAQRCRARAVRLPIAEHLGPLPKGKGVLNVNDVFAALLAVHAGQDWRAALEAVIPQRFRPAAAAGAAAAGVAAGGGLPDQKPTLVGGVADASLLQQAAPIGSEQQRQGAAVEGEAAGQEAAVEPGPAAKRAAVRQAAAEVQVQAEQEPGAAPPSTQ